MKVRQIQNKRGGSRVASVVRVVEYVFVVVLTGMLLLRSGVFVGRIVREWKQSEAKWQPANENELMIWNNYQRVGE